MAHTTKSLIERLWQEIAKRGIPDRYRYETLDHDTDETDEPEAVQDTIIIEVKSGTVIAVRGLPDGYQYEILDHDVESEQ